MAIAIKKSSVVVTETPSTSLPTEVLSQIENNTKLDTTDYTNQIKEEPVEKGKRTDDLVQLKFSKGKRAEAKSFFSSYDLKMNQGFEMAYEFLKQEVNAGNVKISKSGFQRIKKAGE